MSTQKRKFELFARLQRLGFTYEESAALRRIEMTLSRWSEGECNGEIEREGDDEFARPFRVWHDSQWKRHAYPIADREAGALRRLKAIVDARNAREEGTGRMQDFAQDHVFTYQQGDPRGCALYLITREQVTDKQTGALLPLDQYYTRGLAVCA